MSNLLGLDDLKSRIAAGEIATVICAMPDLWGRLVGKRLTAKNFLSAALGSEGVHASVYLFCVDMDMDPRPGYALTGWDKGFQDCVMRPDLSTIRVLPWVPKTAFVLCDAVDHDGVEMAMAPRTILKRQLARAAALGFSFKCASELEFFLFRDSYDEAWEKRYRGLKPTSRYRADYHMLQSTRDEPLIGELCAMMEAAGIEVENAKTEWGLGQQEIALRYADALEMADRHLLYKNWVKEIVSQHGLSATFMAKPFINEVGSSCHVHVSLWGTDGNPASFDAATASHMAPRFGAFVAGMIAGGRDYALMFAPTVNSYKRFRRESFAPVQLVCGGDNRTCGFRLVGHGPSFRVESRIPGADANPYLVLAGILASGLDGIEAGLPTPPIYDANAYLDASLPRVPPTLRDAVALFADSAAAKAAFGDITHAHLTHFYRQEVEAFEQETVTDWEMMRYFERI